MVLGEFDEDTIEDMASSSELTDFYIEMLKEHEIDESDDVIINLGLDYLLGELEDNPKNFYKVCKECLIVQYLHLTGDDTELEDLEDEKRIYTLNQLLNNADSN